MPLPPLTVLTYASDRRGAASRLVDVLDEVKPSIEKAMYGLYQSRRLMPSQRLLGWAHADALFEVSRTGAVRVWSDGRLLASDCPHDCIFAGVTVLDQKDIAYLEAYLFRQGRCWSDVESIRLQV